MWDIFSFVQYVGNIRRVWSFILLLIYSSTKTPKRVILMDGNICDKFVPYWAITDKSTQPSVPQTRNEFLFQVWSVGGRTPLSADQVAGRLLLLRLRIARGQARSRSLHRGDGTGHDRRYSVSWCFIATFFYQFEFTISTAFFACIWGVF